MFDYANQSPPEDAEFVAWDDPRLARLYRIRLLDGYGAWTVSYCWGTLRSGAAVRVRLPFHEIPKRRRASFILRHARAAGVYAKRLGLLDPTTYSHLS